MLNSNQNADAFAGRVFSILDADGLMSGYNIKNWVKKYSKSYEPHLLLKAHFRTLSEHGKLNDYSLEHLVEILEEEEMDDIEDQNSSNDVAKKFTLKMPARGKAKKKNKKTESNREQSYIRMAFEAIVHTKHAGKGVSREKIADYIKANFDGIAEGAQFNTALRKALKNGIECGVLEEGQTNQRYKITNLGNGCSVTTVSTWTPQKEKENAKKYDTKALILFVEDNTDNDVEKEWKIMPIGQDDENDNDDDDDEVNHQ